MVVVNGEEELPPGFDFAQAIECDYAEVDNGAVKLYATIQVGGWDADGGYYGIVIGEGPAQGERWYW